MINSAKTCEEAADKIINQNVTASAFPCNAKNIVVAPLHKHFVDKNDT